VAGPYIFDRTKETSTTTDTGTYTLAGAVTGFRSFSVVGNGNTCFYCAENGVDWEVGVGTYTLSGTTLARTTILASSNGGAAVSWAAGTRNVFITAPADWFGTPWTPGAIPFAVANGLQGQDPTALFWDAANDFLGLGTNAPAQRLHVSTGNVRFDHVAVPAACAAALAGLGAGNVDNGNHVYKVVFTTALGDSDLGTGVVLTVANKTTNGQVSLTSIATGTANVVTSRKVYRTKAGGGPFYLLTTIADNTTTTYMDNTADSSLTTIPVAQTSTAGRVYAGATGGAIFTSGAKLQGAFFDRSGAVRNVMAYGAMGAGTTKQNGAMTALGVTLTSSGFAATDVGKVCSVAWAGTNQIANPTTAATVNITGGGSTGGGLAAGTYRVKYTWVTSWGETTGGTSESTTFTPAAGNIPRVTIPSLPANATGANIYLTPVGGTTNTEILYSTGITGTTADLALVQRTDGATVPAVNLTAGPLNSVIKTFNSSTSVDLADAATNTVTSADVVYGWDDTAAFQSAIDVGPGMIFVPPGNFILSTLKLDTYQWLYGAGWGTQLIQRGGTNGHLISNLTTTSLGSGVYNMTLNGFRSHATFANDAVHFADATSQGDEIYTIHNCFITSWSGNGVYLGNEVREVRILSCYILYCNLIGLLIDTSSTDHSVLQLDVGHSGVQNIKLVGGTNRLGGVKSFWPGDRTSSLGYGFHIVGDNNELSGCEAQDCTSHGWFLEGCDRTAISNGTSNNNAGDAFRLDACTDCKIYGQVLDFNRTTSTSIINLVNSALRNQTLIAFSAGSVASGIQYVQGTVTGNDIHVGPDGGYQVPAFPGTRTWTVVAATDVITTSSAHGLSLNDPVLVSNSGGALPASTPQIVINIPYYVKTIPSSTTLTLSATPGGAVIDFTGTGTGTQTMQLPLLPNPYQGIYHQLTLTADTPVANTVSEHQGQRLSFEFTQDGTGGRRILWGDSYSVRRWTPNTAASKINSIEFIYNGTTWVQLSGINDSFPSPVILDRQTTTVNFLEAAGDQTLYSVAIAADLLGLNGGVQVRIYFDYAHASGTARIITFKVQFGATVLWADATTAMPVGAGTRICMMELNLSNRNATNSQYLAGILHQGSMAAATTGQGDLLAGPAATTNLDNPFAGTSAIDTTVTNTLSVLINIAVATGVDPSANRQLAIAEFIPGS